MLIIQERPSPHTCKTIQNVTIQETVSWEPQKANYRGILGHVYLIFSGILLIPGAPALPTNGLAVHSCSREVRKAAKQKSDGTT